MREWPEAGRGLQTCECSRPEAMVETVNRFGEFENSPLARALWFSVRAALVGFGHARVSKRLRARQEANQSSAIENNNQ